MRYSVNIFRRALSADGLQFQEQIFTAIWFESKFLSYKMETESWSSSVRSLPDVQLTTLTDV